MVNRHHFLFGLVLVLAAACLPCRADDPKQIRVGIIGLDTSHAIAFTRILNDEKAPPEFVAKRRNTSR